MKNLKTFISNSLVIELKENKIKIKSFALKQTILNFSSGQICLKGFRENKKDHCLKTS